MVDFFRLIFRGLALILGHVAEVAGEGHLVALVGVNGAPGAAWDALVAAFGEDRARDVAQITTTHPEDQRP